MSDYENEVRDRIASGGGINKMHPGKRATNHGMAAAGQMAFISRELLLGKYVHFFSEKDRKRLRDGSFKQHELEPLLLKQPPREVMLFKGEFFARCLKDQLKLADTLTDSEVNSTLIFFIEAAKVQGSMGPAAAAAFSAGYLPGPVQDQYLDRLEEFLNKKGAYADKLLETHNTLETSLAETPEADNPELQAARERAKTALAQSSEMMSTLEMYGADFKRMRAIDQELASRGITVENIRKMPSDELVTMMNSFMSDVEKYEAINGDGYSGEFVKMLDDRMGPACATVARHRLAYFSLINALPKVRAGSTGSIPGFTVETVETLSVDDLIFMLGSAMPPEMAKRVEEGVPADDPSMKAYSLGAIKVLSSVLAPEVMEAVASKIGEQVKWPRTEERHRPVVTSGPPVSHTVIRDKLLTEMLGCDMYATLPVQAGDPVVPFAQWKGSAQITDIFKREGVEIEGEELTTRLMIYHAFAMFHQGHRRTFRISNELLKGLLETNVNSVPSVLLRLPYPVMCIEFPLGNNLFIQANGVPSRLSCCYCVEEEDQLTVVAACVPLSGAHDDFCPVYRFRRAEGARVGDLVKQAMERTESLEGAQAVKEHKKILRVMLNSLLYCNSGPDRSQERYGPTTEKLKAHPKKSEEWKAQLKRIAEREPIIIDIGKAYKFPTAEELGGRSGGPKYTIKFQFTVRGHWTNQAYGPKMSLRKALWIKPYTKNPGAEWINKDYKVIDSTAKAPKEPTIPVDDEEED